MYRGRENPKLLNVETTQRTVGGVLNFEHKNARVSSRPHDDDDDDDDCLVVVVVVVL